MSIVFMVICYFVEYLVENGMLMGLGGLLILGWLRGIIKVML